MEIDAKEKTAPDSSVGADEGQPIQKDNNRVAFLVSRVFIKTYRQMNRSSKSRQ